jgi:HTH-type transcriptional regulator, sugar sensing transcriptional regulator
MSLENDLKQIGLEEKEARVYLAALELGATNIQNLTNKSNIKRSTIYEMIKSLENKGLISETIRGKRKVYIAAEPENLKRSIQDKQRLFNDMLPELRAITNTGSIKPKIMFFEGRNGIQEIYKDTLKSGEKMTLWISPIQSMLETIGEEFLNNYVEERTRKGIWVKSVYITTQKVSDYKYLDPKTFEKTLRKIKFTPKEINIKNTMCIYGNRVAIISSRKELFGFVIESIDYASMLKVFHDLLWNISKPWHEMDFDKSGQTVENEDEEKEDDYWSINK